MVMADNYLACKLALMSYTPIHMEMLKGRY